jgi:hypothetical protein
VYWDYKRPGVEREALPLNELTRTQISEQIRYRSASDKAKCYEMGRWQSQRSIVPVKAGK